MRASLSERVRRWQGWSVSAVLAVGVGACAGDGPAGDAVFWRSRSDRVKRSVVHVEWGEIGERYRWSEERRIGAGVDLGAVRAGALLPGGMVAVLETQPPSVLVFDSKGELERTIGRRGQGPGELMSPNALILVPPDTLVIYDPGERRLTWFLVDGSVLRVEAVGDGPPTHGGVTLVGVDDAGGIIVTREEQTAFELAEGVHYRPNLLLGRLAGRPVAEMAIAELPGMEREIRNMRPPGPAGAAGAGLVSTPARGGPDMRLVVGSGCVVIAYDSGDGTLTRIEYRDALNREEACGDASGGVWIPASPRTPAGDDDIGEVWLRVVLDHLDSPTYFRLPAGRQLLSAGDSGALVVRRDSLGVQTLYVVSKSGGPSVQ